MKLPIKSLKAVQRYCSKQQCRRCEFGEDWDGRVECRLMQNAPCDWEIEDKQNESNISGR